MPAAATTPSAADTHTAHAVVTPRTGSRTDPFAITPAPMKPTPVQTCAAARTGSPPSMPKTQASVYSALPDETSVIDRSPAGLSASFRSNPMMAPHAAATSSREATTSSMSSCCVMHERAETSPADGPAAPATAAAGIACARRKESAHGHDQKTSISRTAVNLGVLYTGSPHCSSLSASWWSSDADDGDPVRLAALLLICSDEDAMASARRQEPVATARGSKAGCGLTMANASRAMRGISTVSCCCRPPCDGQAGKAC
mmetsp:Transcript_7667/g.25152  ORF Transcript_7667/g.25152 Transcript_7667/m.25152 type:complete len:258 (+) Transcript_7667:571-1344(+)|eukprot:scaffold21033_cov112-Isochrysis_galbana.AAC.2